LISDFRWSFFNIADVHVGPSQSSEIIQFGSNTIFIRLNCLQHRPKIFDPLAQAENLLSAERGISISPASRWMQPTYALWPSMHHITLTSAMFCPCCKVQDEMPDM